MAKSEPKPVPQEGSHKPVESVVAQPAKIIKKKNKRVIFEQDFLDIRESLFIDHVKPRAKTLANNILQAVLDTISESVQMMIFNGDVKFTRNGGNGGGTNYGSFSKKNPVYQNNTPTMTTSYNYDEITYATEEQALEVLAKMKEMLNQYDDVPVARLYEFSDVLNTNYMNESYGWTSLDGVKTYTVFVDGELRFGLRLPKARPLRG